MANAATIRIANDVRIAMAGSALTERQAKLYSQRLRRDMGQEGLASFRTGDVNSYLDEAKLLLECALLERNADPLSAWREGIKRAAEILEWLSQPSLKPPSAPLHLLAAAAYQLAEYPAMALGHLRRVPEEEPISLILHEFLRANFPGALEATLGFWRDQRALGAAERIDPADLNALTFQHVVMCIGTICAYLRTGDFGKIDRALTKLEKLAKSLLHSSDPYSYLLAKLTAASSRRFSETCFWPQIEKLRRTSSDSANSALNQFARLAFTNRRVLVWPGQTAGIDQLSQNTSFALCTPTGSGKTTVATVAIIQSLFQAPSGNTPDLEASGFGNLILYLVPSRALAAEVEGRLSQDLNGITGEPVVITGLYGGNDWGPTDAWIQTDRATILICTFEKADALVRFLGVLFLSRVRLVVVDEAHMVEQARLSGLEDASSRSLRLEQLGARLLQAQDNYGFRILALSAVAASAAPAIARWIGGVTDARPITSSYRSTRQMLGRMEITDGGQFAIRYDLMDGRSLKFQDERQNDTPYVVNPFPRFPGGLASDEGPEVRMRGPTLWAALQLASQRPDGSTPSVLISLPQRIQDFAATCAKLIEEWPLDSLPNYRNSNIEDDQWNRCLASAADYFTKESIEYRLLKRGIAVHHGKMPGLLARRLKILIDRSYIRVIIATSTLSEGVNIPVNYLLMPSVFRGQNLLNLQEFTNLIGRAGRPGVATEGSALVILPSQTNSGRQWNGYETLVNAIERTTIAASVGTPEDKASSPLASLLKEIERVWRELTNGGSPIEFNTWLEQTAVIDAPDNVGPAFNFLDTLDAFLITAIQEIEEIRQGDLLPAQVEAELTNVWRKTYAFAAAQDEERLRNIWLTRGKSIKVLYPNNDTRRRIYKTSLSPRSATNLLNLTEIIRSKLQEGAGYADWSPEERLAFIQAVLALLSQVPSFRIGTDLGSRHNFEDWPLILKWWLSKASLISQPTPKQISNWYEFVSKNFIHKGAWGLGSIIGLLMDDADGTQPIRALEIEDWPRCGLPWIAFWMKELITWGTLDPVAAFLLARGDAIDRPHAEEEAKNYYESLNVDINVNDKLDPRKIRNWIESRRNLSERIERIDKFELLTELVRPEGDFLENQLTIFPLVLNDNITWIDVAGYPVAKNQKPTNWPEQISDFDFKLEVTGTKIVCTPYHQHL